MRGGKVQWVSLLFLLLCIFCTSNLPHLSSSLSESIPKKSLDIVYPDSKRCCCFTKSYYRYVKGTGSLLATIQVWFHFKLSDIWPCSWEFPPLFLVELLVVNSSCAFISRTHAQLLSIILSTPFNILDWICCKVLSCGFSAEHNNSVSIELYNITFAGHVDPAKFVWQNQLVAYFSIW